MWHIQRTVPNWTETLNILPGTAAVKATEDYQMFREVKGYNPDLFTTHRMVRDNWQVYWGKPDSPWFDPETAKAMARSWFNAFIDGTFRDQISAYCDSVSWHNEIWANSQNEIEQDERVKAAEAAVHVWNTEYRPTFDNDISLIIGEAAVGNWMPRQLAALSIDSGNLLGYHPYEWWTNKQRSDEGFRAATSMLWDAMELNWQLEPDWIFTEAGPLESAVTGWRSKHCLGRDRDLYVEAVKLWIRDVAETEAYAEGRIKGFHLFTTFTTEVPDWGTFHTDQPELNMLAGMIAEEWKPGTKPPVEPPVEPPTEPECRGLPREQYNREYWVLNNNMTQEQETVVFSWAREEKKTIGWSYDDAGIGDLDNITAVLWNIDENLHQVFLDWYAEHYPGVVVEFRDIVEDTFAILNIVEDLPVHETKVYSNRPLTDITALTIHHTVTPSDTPIEQIASYHVNTRDWPGIGYHYVIKDDGTVYQTNYLTTKSYHAGSYNAPGDENLWSVGIALQGDFTNSPPPQEQLDAARWLIEELKDQFGELEVIPHKQMPGAQTQCPGNTWEEWFDYVAGLEGG